jgi:hypothetical protein
VDGVPLELIFSRSLRPYHPIIIPALLHTHLPRPHDVCDSPDQATHYRTLGTKLGASSPFLDVSRKFLISSAVHVHGVVFKEVRRFSCAFCGLFVSTLPRSAEGTGDGGDVLFFSPGHLDECVPSCLGWKSYQLLYVCWRCDDGTLFIQRRI